jgi:hypothetical protein
VTITAVIIILTITVGVDVTIALYLWHRPLGPSPSAGVMATGGTGGAATINGPLVASAPAGPGTPATSGVIRPAIQATWAQLVPENALCDLERCDPRVLVRAIVPLGASCASLARAAKNNLPVGLQRRENREPDRFPIDVCEALLTLDQEGVNFEDGSAIRWKGLQAGPRAISIIGDTGCQDEHMQDCNAVRAWPLAHVAAEAAWHKHTTAPSSGQPDLVIHVGDYRYRGDDNWAEWQQDFFAPMRPLLLAAPWVMVRGNHENCYGESGVGWALLLSPSYGLVPDCKASARYNRASIEPVAPIDLSGLRLVTLDAADAKYRCRSWHDTFEAQELPRLKALLDPNRNSGRGLWLVTHYPVLSAYKSEECPVGAKRASVAEYQRLLVSVLQNAPVDAILAGDLHSLQLLQSKPGALGTRAIVQFVAGNGGTQLDDLKYASDQLKGTCAKTAGGDGIDCDDVELGTDQGYAASSKAKAHFRFAHGLTTAVTTDGKTWSFASRTLPSGRTELECTIPLPAGAKCGPP